jgi:stage II sporulation protein R
MKKYLILASLILVFIPNLNKESDEIIIPDEAIRFRVVAESNTKEDQEAKTIVKTALEADLDTLLNNSTSIDETRTILKENQSHFESIVKRTLLTNKINTTYKVNYGINYFPEKKYKGVIYEEGYYESLVITLGKGNGENWWCVLFPPLCLMEGEDNNTDEVEYKSFVKEMIDKYF